MFWPEGRYNEDAAWAFHRVEKSYLLHPSRVHFVAMFNKVQQKSRK